MEGGEGRGGKEEREEEVRRMEGGERRGGKEDGGRKRQGRGGWRGVGETMRGGRGGRFCREGFLSQAVKCSP